MGEKWLIETWQTHLDEWSIKADLRSPRSMWRLINPDGEDCGSFATFRQVIEAGLVLRFSGTEPEVAHV